MNPFKPKRTFASVVAEIVSGLEDGSIILNKVAAARQSMEPVAYGILYSKSLEIKMNTSSAPSRPHRRKFVAEWVKVDLDLPNDPPIDFGPSIAAPIGR